MKAPQETTTPETRKDMIKLMVPANNLLIDGEEVVTRDSFVSVEIEVEVLPIQVSYETIRQDLIKAGIHNRRQQDRIVESMLDGMYNETRMMALQSFVI